MKIDCSKTVNYLKESYRLCQHYGDDNCRECPLYSRNNEKAASCTELATYFPEETIDIVQKWSDEHPQKTRLELFYENYPNAPHHDGVPDACVEEFGYEGYAERHTDECEFCQECYMCRKCWNMPV